MIDDDEIEKKLQDETAQGDSLDLPEEPEVDDELVPEPEPEPEVINGPVDPKGPLGLRGPVGLEGPALTHEENEAFEKIQGRVYFVLKETLPKHDLDSATNWVIYTRDPFAERRTAINFLTWALVSGVLHKPENVEYSDDRGGKRILDSDGNFWAALQETFNTMMEMPPIA